MKRLVLSALMVVATCGASAQSYPSKPLRMVVPFGTGGAPDILARLYGQKLQDVLGQSVVVDNRGGAGGNVGTETVVKSAPDGYTLLMATTANVSINQSLYPSLAFDPLRDLAPVALVAYTPIMLVVANDVPARTLAELIQYAKANPGKLTFASSGSGTMQHIPGELMKTMAGVDLVHVPYKGSGQVMPDLMAGRVSMMFNSFAAVLPFVKEGKLRAIGVASASRSPLVPDIPTLAESGLPGFEASAWYAVFAPAGTPADVVRRLNAVVAKASGEADVKARLAQLGLDPAVMSPEDLGALARRDMQKWTKVIRDNHIRAE